jgi:hypothetical protein
MAATTLVPIICQFCYHATHEPKLCSTAGCKCKCKPGFWRKLFDGLGNAIGEAKFGG